MTRNLKALGLAFVAVCAVGALSAASASATDFFTTDGDAAAVTGVSHDNRLSITDAEVDLSCTTARFVGTFEDGSSVMTVLPSYTGTENVTPHTTHCSGLGTPTFDMNHCEYKLTGETTGSDNGTDATLWIQCPTGQRIQMTTHLGCTIEFPSQTPTSGGVTYTNLPNHSGGAAIRLTTTITGITYTAHGFACALGGLATEGNDMDYTGTVDLTGYEDLGSHGLVQGETNYLTTLTDGARTPIEVS